MTTEAITSIRQDYLKARKDARSITKTLARGFAHTLLDDTIMTNQERLTKARSVYELARVSLCTTDEAKADEQQTLTAMDADQKRRKGLKKILTNTKLRTAVGVGLTVGIGVSAATGLLPVTGALFVARGGLQAYGLAGGVKMLEEQIEKRKHPQLVNPADNEAVDKKIKQDRNAALKRGVIAVGIAGVTGSLSLLHAARSHDMYKFVGKDKLFGDKSSLTGFAQGEYARKITGQVLHPFDYLSERNYEMHLTKLFGTDWRHSMGYHNVIAGYVKHLQIMNHVSGDLVSHTQPLVM